MYGLSLYCMRMCTIYCILRALFVWCGNLTVFGANLFEKSYFRRDPV